MTTARALEAIRAPGQQIDVLHSLREAVVAGILTMVILGPITNLVLDQYDFHFYPLREPLLLNGIMLGVVVALGRLAVSLGVQTRVGHELMQRFARQDSSTASVPHIP